MPGSTPAHTLEGVAKRLASCVRSISSLPDSLPDTVAQASCLAKVARECWSLVDRPAVDLAMLQQVEAQLHIPRARPLAVSLWFGRTKQFPDAGRLAEVIEHGVPIAVAQGSNVGEALAYGNHRSIEPYHDTILCKIYSDVRQGRAFVFPRAMADRIPGLRLSPLRAVVSPSKVRIIHDLSFEFEGRAPSVNAETDFESAPPVELGHVLRDFIWRILFPRAKWPRGRIVLSKMNVPEAFRQVRVSPIGNQVFAYVFQDWIVLDRCLMFGWRYSPGYFCLFSSALLLLCFCSATCPAGDHARNHIGLLARKKGYCPCYSIVTGRGGAARVTSPRIPGTAGYGGAG